MPKCLDCNNTEKFWYQETSHKLGSYNQDGTLEDVLDDYYDEVEGGQCYECKSENIEGLL